MIQIPEEYSGEKRACLELLNKHLELGERFENPGYTRLLNPEGIKTLDIAISAAKQCYRSGEFLPEGSETYTPDEKALALAHDTLDAGHITTRQHKYFNFFVSGVTRHLIENVFHAHPFYNSDQQSQRYAKLNHDWVLIPNLEPEQKELYKETVDLAYEAFYKLTKALEPVVRNGLSKRYKEKELDDKTEKVTQEIARYTIPLAQTSIFYHTINESVLLRLFAMSNFPQMTDEGRYVVASMIQSIGEVDPTIYEDLRMPIEAPREQVLDPETLIELNRSFDASLEGHSSKIVDFPHHVAMHSIAASIARELGIVNFDDVELLDELLDPQKNSIIGNKLGLGFHAPLTKLLTQLHFTFKTKMSSITHSQAQRHRETPYVLSSWDLIPLGNADYATPSIIQNHPEIKALYDDYMSKIYANINECLRAGIPMECAKMLLPNAHNVRVTESGDLLSWLNRWHQRLCFNAQEEIFGISIDQVNQALSKVPLLSKVLTAPCRVNFQRGTTPCPEGKRRFCRVPVWSKEVDGYRDLRGDF